MKQRGYTLTEVLVGLGLMSLLFIVGMSLFSTALSSLNRTDTRLALSQTNALALRRVTEEIRSVFTLDVSEDGRAIFYEMPQISGDEDPITGEYEYKYPMVGDGITRSVYYKEGKLWYQIGDDTPIVIADDIVAIDPDKKSSYFNQEYPNFAFANVGSANGIKIILISQAPVSGGKEFNRQTITVLLRNYR